MVSLIAFWTCCRLPEITSEIACSTCCCPLVTRSLTWLRTFCLLGLEVLDDPLIRSGPC